MDRAVALCREIGRNAPLSVRAAKATLNRLIIGDIETALATETLTLMRAAGLGHIPLVVGGIIPEDDAASLRAMGVAAVYTPKDFELNRIMLDIVGIVDAQPAAA